jgi:hypothetical protein
MTGKVLLEDATSYQVQTKIIILNKVLVVWC